MDTTQHSNTKIKPQQVDKESVEGLKFPSADVLSSPEDKIRRRVDLERAMRAGNLEKVKYSIVFEDNEGVKEVRTTIWATTENNVLLKRNAAIPIHRIYKVTVC